jgi:hypothetical protein
MWQSLQENYSGLVASSNGRTVRIHADVQL